MSGGRFISYGQNNEDVVLWRALAQVAAGHFVEVSAKHPQIDSAARAFYDHGWSGVTVEAALAPTARLDDLLAATGWGHSGIQFMLIDVKGAAADVLSTVDLSVWRPWVLVIGATVHTSTAGRDRRPESTADMWEPALLAAGYEFCLFDGVSRFYVAKEHSELRPLLSYPACALDDFARFPEENLKAQLAAANRQLLYWRSAAIRSWGSAMVGGMTEAAALKKAISVLNTISVLKGKLPRPVKTTLRKVRNAQRALARRAR